MASEGSNSNTSYLGGGHQEDGVNVFLEVYDEKMMDNYSGLKYRVGKKKKKEKEKINKENYALEKNCLWVLQTKPLGNLA